MSKFPFFSMQQLNLDWLMKQMQKILAFLPIDSGHAGQILQRGSQSARWVNIGAVSMDIHGLETAETVTGSDELPVYNTSVEGNRKMTISALAAMLPSPSAPVTSVNGKTGAVVLDAEDVGALPDSYTAPVTSVNGMTGDVIVSGGGAVESVNGKTGEVVLTAADVGALPDTAAYADMFFGNNVYPLTVSLNGELDPDNDCIVVASGVQYQRSANKTTLRIFGNIEIAIGSNTGWRTFEITGLDIADIRSGYNYIHRDYACNMYENTTPARQIWLSTSGTFVNYRIMADKTIRLFVNVSSALIGKTVLITFDGDPFQIA